MDTWGTPTVSPAESVRHPPSVSRAEPVKAEALLERFLPGADRGYPGGCAMLCLRFGNVICCDCLWLVLASQEFNTVHWSSLYRFQCFDFILCKASNLQNQKQKNTFFKNILSVWQDIHKRRLMRHPHYYLHVVKPFFPWTFARTLLGSLGSAVPGVSGYTYIHIHIHNILTDWLIDR